jgi:hypothetical protein
MGPDPGIGDSHVMLSDEFPEMGYLGPKARGGATSSLMIYLEDVDAAFRRALDAGASEERPPKDEFWGDRMGTLVDPFGHRWILASHVEDVAPDEMERRMAAYMPGACAGNGKGRSAMADRPRKLLPAEYQLRQDWVSLPGAVYSISSVLALIEYPSAV